MLNKKDMFSIGEIAGLIGITRKIILNYEAKGLITPDIKEGTSGNRYYTIDSFTQIRTIRIFQKLGLSLDEIKDYFNDATDLELLIHRLETMRDELNLNIERLYERANKTQDIISVINVPKQTVYRRIYTSCSIDEKSVLLRKTALDAMRLYSTDTTKRMYFTEHCKIKPDEIAYCVAIPPECKGKFVVHIPAFRAISTFHHGAYEELPLVCKNLEKYASDNKINISDRCMHIYLEGPPQHKDPKRFITQVIIPIKDSLT